MSKKQVAPLTRALMGALHWSFLDRRQAGEADGILTLRDLPTPRPQCLWAGPRGIWRPLRLVGLPGIFTNMTEGVQNSQKTLLGFLTCGCGLSVGSSGRATTGGPASPGWGRHPAALMDLTLFGLLFPRNPGNKEWPLKCSLLFPQAGRPGAYPGMGLLGWQSDLSQRHCHWENTSIWQSFMGLKSVNQRSRVHKSPPEKRAIRRYQDLRTALGRMKSWTRRHRRRSSCWRRRGSHTPGRALTWSNFQIPCQRSY